MHSGLKTQDSGLKTQDCLKVHAWAEVLGFTTVSAREAWLRAPSGCPGAGSGRALPDPAVMPGAARVWN